MIDLFLKDSQSGCCEPQCPVRENRDPTLTHWTVGVGSKELNAPCPTPFRKSLYLSMFGYECPFGNQKIENNDYKISDSL